MTATTFDDLLGKPWDLLNCGDVVSIGLQRLGRENPTPEHVIESATRAVGLHARPDDLHAFIDSHLELVELGHEERGDIVFVKRGPGAEVNHDGLVLERGLMLHSTRQRGVRKDRIASYADRIDCIGRTRAC